MFYVKKNYFTLKKPPSGRQYKNNKFVRKKNTLTICRQNKYTSLKIQLWGAYNEVLRKSFIAPASSCFQGNSGPERLQSFPEK